ncbi:unnamed protein product [Miscanthus lutarioriparius]|uniref:Disease resistance R13L4/SHOC-2-like LRR domain-containing protein n=1 Tax=Miscanthus lutarioriparius TaxID=422564 RepID=A0A811QF53_9POAL|nr:unnamed protein product [Miscanthus lutarioriparius]
MGILEELGQLTELRVLKIVLIEWDDKLVGCLNKLLKIQDLSIWAYAWMSPPSSLLPDLSSLSILVREVRQADLDILGRLSALRYLNLEVDHENLGIILGGLVICTGSFSCLVQCRFWNFLVPVAFQEGSMPRLQTLKFQFSVRGLRSIASGNGGLDLGLGNLPSFQHLNVHLDSQGASNEEVEELEAALWHAIDIHPNHPQLYM